MRFRLTYEGELRASQKDEKSGKPDLLGPHKHLIRRHFHRQLKVLWETSRPLSTALKYPSDFGLPLPAPEEPQLVPLLDIVSKLHKRFGYAFVPLVRKQEPLLCSLNIVFLRRDIPGSALQAGDIDNRIKTIIDALRMPQNVNELHSGDEVPGEGETPFYCLLEDDSQVSEFHVETDTLLDEHNGNDRDHLLARLFITVEIRPYYVTWGSMLFA